MTFRVVNLRTSGVISTHATSAEAERALKRHTRRLARSLNKPGMQGGVSWLSDYAVVAPKEAEPMSSSPTPPKGAPMTADPFATIPNSDDCEYAGTELETPGERERREDKGGRPMTATKTPTASGISRLLATAGFERADIDWGHAGFKVEKCRTREDAVKVYRYNPASRSGESYGPALRRYAKAIEAAGYSTEVYDYRLIVTAKEGD